MIMPRARGEKVRLFYQVSILSRDRDLEYKVPAAFDVLTIKAYSHQLYWLALGRSGRVRWRKVLWQSLSSLLASRIMLTTPDKIPVLRRMGKQQIYVHSSCYAML